MRSLVVLLISLLNRKVLLKVKDVRFIDIDIKMVYYSDFMNYW